MSNGMQRNGGMTIAEFDQLQKEAATYDQQVWQAAFFNELANCGVVPTSQEDATEYLKVAELINQRINVFESDSPQTPGAALNKAAQAAFGVQNESDYVPVSESAYKAAAALAEDQTASAVAKLLLLTEDLYQANEAAEQNQGA